jgi:hypothetical protein
MTYHWGWYLLGLLVLPRITFMIFLQLHVPIIPLWFIIMGWIWAIGNDIICNPYLNDKGINNEKKKA